MKARIVGTSGDVQLFDPERFQHSLEALMDGIDSKFVDVSKIVSKVTEGLSNELSVKELVQFTAEVCASMTTVYYQYSKLGSRLLTKQLQESLPSKFSDNVAILRSYDPHPSPNRTNYKHLISEELYDIVMTHSKRIDSAIVSKRDFDIDYFGFKTLERSYMLKVDGLPHETVQFLLMRVALGIHGADIDSALESYDLMSRKYFLPASPTLFNAGTEFANLSSCFLVAMEDDSLDGIFKTIHKCAMISKASGGIGVHISNIRAAGSYISGTNGVSSGIAPMLRVFNTTAKYVDQGGNRRPGAICAYLEPWHADILQFLDMKKNYGKEDLRARDMFYALWIPDLFMRRVEADQDWSLFSEDTAPGLSDVYGEEFDALYQKYEAEGLQMDTVRARKVWEKILYSQTETGTPFMLYKDACNRKSNQKNLGTIKSSNLCCEIVEYSSKDEIAVCNLSSLGLPTFVSDDKFDFKLLHKVTKVVVRNLNKVIDRTEYPLEECRRSNMRHRPMAVGVQGLADTFMKLRMVYGSPESKELNRQIFETIYHGALEQSVELARKDGTYSSYDGSPASKGVLQYDMWGTEPSDLWDWASLKKDIANYGLRNSLLVALMPTASTSQILGYSECFGPLTSNLYTRRVLSGEHQVVNRYMVDDLAALGLWTKEAKDSIIASNGSIQGIDHVPDDLKHRYRTVWEISQRDVIDMAADRSPYVDQSQSMNLFIRDCTLSKMTSMHFYAWKKGLKTGMYYLRTQAPSEAIKFTLTPEVEKRGRKRTITAALACSLDSPDECESCSG